MMLTNKNNDMTDTEIIEKANKAIIKELGVSGYMRYLRLRQPNNEGKDFVKEQEELYKDLSVDDLSQMARKHWENTK
ncbi:hypothetical protein [Ruminiclostridium cellobioparum]|jgi:hypothetical protein|uniref:Uncharacterized protein n=1 Tax=Ruminiclostridium cellobioparum subsp. termitidis CT1112 TaxID=1195236 RepID=S0FSJ8_RUMCE|nr:hypothetical protein [Ruminiclostridium cellobioparum]EMS71478.1 hypothetical protein CTER_2611 [Ruminiclostridium cellobioparum subsp. termitidis CT1112]